MKIEDKSIIAQGRVLISFWAPWCTPCKAAKPVVEKFAELNDKVNVYFCNVDSEHEMASVHGIRVVPTLVYMENGETLNRKSGTIISYDLIERMINV